MEWDRLDTHTHALRRFMGIKTGTTQRQRPRFNLLIVLLQVLVFFCAAALMPFIFIRSECVQCIYTSNQFPEQAPLCTAGLLSGRLGFFPLSSCVLLSFFPLLFIHIALNDLKGCHCTATCSINRTKRTYSWNEHEGMREREPT